MQKRNRAEAARTASSSIAAWRAMLHHTGRSHGHARRQGEERPVVYFATQRCVVASHLCCAAHVPQARLPPQPSAMVPQVAPSWPQLVGVHPHWLGTPPAPHAPGGLQVPQFRMPPQPFAAWPHLAERRVHVVGVQLP